MGATVKVTGTLKELFIHEGKDFEGWAEEICRGLGEYEDLPEFYQTWADLFSDIAHDLDFYQIKGKWYKFQGERKFDAPLEHVYVNKKDNGEIEFSILYYNSVPWDEILEEHL